MWGITTNFYERTFTGGVLGDGSKLTLSQMVNKGTAAVPIMGATVVATLYSRGYYNDLSSTVTFTLRGDKGIVPNPN
ncbi:MAG: hypothetical protein H7338_22725 [Candidatus Sericytochromatia bacterium]|nr:hypothetical protein [Candidatus Sericytochromatia bacterium]